VNRFKRLTAILVAVVSAVALWGRGTSAGTEISNQAEISYLINGTGTAQTLSSNLDRFVVDKVVDIRIDWSDTDAVEVDPGEPDRVLSFLVTNLGNGDDNVTLSYEHNESASFDPSVENVRIYLDRDGDGVFDQQADQEVDRIALSEDENATLFIVADIPDAPDANSSYEKLKARSESNGTTGAEDPAQVDVVIRRGEDEAQGVYTLRDYHLVSEKSQEILSSDGELHTGSVVRYTLVVAIEGGDGRIENVVLEDEIPEGTEYLPGSMTLDGSSLSDTADGDAGTLLEDPDRIRVDLGTLEQSSPGRTERNVTFEVRVK